MHDRIVIMSYDRNGINYNMLVTIYKTWYIIGLLIIIILLRNKMLMILELTIIVYTAVMDNWKNISFAAHR